MSFKVNISGGSLNYVTRVTKRGELITGPLDYSEFYSATTTVANTAVNVIPPKTNMQFVITAIVLSGNRSIGANGAVVELFENSSGPTDATVTKLIYTDDIAKQTRAVIPNINVIVSVGTWVNVKSDDVQVLANIAGYYVTNGTGKLL